jgi:magnesium-transporting ATPase (P-type)
MQRLAASEHGLSSDEARQRLVAHGRNTLPHAPPPAWWQILLHQFQSPLIYVLCAAAAVSAAIGEWTDAWVIGGVLMLNALIGGFQEWRAEQSALALQKLLRIRAAVQRDGEVEEIDAEELVPGDVVWLESGNRVPADVRLLWTHGLEVDESLLTGESLAVLKDPQWRGRPDTPLGDRLNCAFAGSLVARGRGKGVVVATGVDTAVGQLALDVTTTEAGKPPLLVRMERFSRSIAVVVLLAAALVMVLGITVRQLPVGEMFLTAVALAVSAIPEGLPIAMTVALAVASTRMARRGVIVRKLAAVEGLGSCTLIATDKTGTLTVNELTVREVCLPDGRRFQVTGQGFSPEGQVLYQGAAVAPHSIGPLDRLARAAVLCNEADLHRTSEGTWHWRGDAVDVAFLALGHKLGTTQEEALDQYPQVSEIPFEPERQFAATFHRVDGQSQAMVCVKGAPERVLAMCDGSPEWREQMRQQAEALAAQGYRVLAVAEGRFSHDIDPHQMPPTPSGLELLGMVGMIDPLRAGVREAIAACREAGVEVWMVTGDHRITALAIARDLGMELADDQVLTGPELQQFDPLLLPEVVRRVRVFARVAPGQKLQLVQAAQQAGHYVAVTGDGVNDAPALRAANIGVAMGRSGTDVAREAAELVISDDNFATIVAGIQEGRIAYDNIRKVIYLLVSTGAAEIVMVLGAVLAGMPLPLLPLQLLWLNLVTNGIQDKALAFEPGESDTLRRPPRSPRERIFNRLMVERIVVAAITMAAVCLLVFQCIVPPAELQASNPNEYQQRLDEARNILLLLMVLFENVHIGNCRSETTSALRLSPLRSPLLLGGALTALAVHVAAMYLPPLQYVLKTRPVDWQEWMMMLPLAVSIFVVMELHKLWWNYQQRRTAQRGAATSAAGQSPGPRNGA